ncbi:hypothetical protein D3C73_1204200 [compost metagenome]
MPTPAVIILITSLRIPNTPELLTSSPPVSLQLTIDVFTPPQSAEAIGAAANEPIPINSARLTIVCFIFILSIKYDKTPRLASVSSQ